MKSATKTHVAWLNTDQAAAHLGFKTTKAFRVWLDRRRASGKRDPKVHWLTGRMRFREVDLDACVDVEPQEKTSAPVLAFEREQR